MAEPRQRGRLTARALVWKRFDFRESSRVVTLLLRDHGRVQALAKGAHRPTSPMLGRIDFLNEVRATLSPDRGGLRLLERAVLEHERRALRVPARYVAASHWCALCDPGFPADRPDPDLFDLLTGGLSLLERCPEPALPVVVLGLELRYLDHLGALPDLAGCGECGGALGGHAFRLGPMLVCRQHAGPGRHGVPGAALELLRELRAAPGRELPQKDPARLSAVAVALPAVWLESALERRCPLRAQVFGGGR